jgi:hypothetical protein
MIIITMILITIAIVMYNSNKIRNRSNKVIVLVVVLWNILLLFLVDHYYNHNKIFIKIIKIKILTQHYHQILLVLKKEENVFVADNECIYYDFIKNKYVPK